MVILTVVSVSAQVDMGWVDVILQQTPTPTLPPPPTKTKKCSGETVLARYQQQQYIHVGPLGGDVDISRASHAVSE